jgi:cell division protein FtsZ
VKSVMQGAGSALMGIGSSRGADRAIKAAELAVASPLLEASIDGAHGVLLSIQGGSNLGIFEINDAARLVQEAVHPEANIIFGAVIDDTLGDEVRVTVIAAGFDGGEPGGTRLVDARRAMLVGAGVGGGGLGTAGAPGNGELAETAAMDPEDLPDPASWGSSSSAIPQAAPIDPAFDDESDDLDIPDFLK